MVVEVFFFTSKTNLDKSSLVLAIVRLDWRLPIPVPTLRSRGLHPASAAGA